MKLKGERGIPLGQNLVWEKLNEPEALRQSIPGCETLTAVSPGVGRCASGPESASVAEMHVGP